MTATPRVVVIDSGVDARHPALRGHTVLAGPAFHTGADADNDDSGRDELGHGTAVAATLVRFLGERPVEITSLRVFGREPVCDFASVLRALEHAVTLRPNVVNLSLGTTSLRFRGALQDLARTAKAAGTRVVAPASYGGLPCDPGTLAEVEAVVGDPNVLPMLPELRPHGGRLVWFASPLPPPDADGVRRLRARGDSLAVAAVSGALLRSAGIHGAA
ncbi:MAG: S8 family serine peptidase [Planctomycetes bacterium]|nr:S8 family serine peptidase [Planctomycetota bacterium]